MNGWLRVGAVVAIAGAALAAQATKTASLSPIEALIGRWEGSSEGQPGTGTVSREYAAIVGGRFIQVRNIATYPPQAASPKGETHEDLGVFSVDRARGRIVLRQFHVEGFVNQYAAEPEAKPGVIVFTSEAIENIPPGWRAQETYTLVAPDTLEEVFELAEPGKAFEVYSRARLTRRK